MERAISRNDANYNPRLTAVAIHLARQDEKALSAALKELLRMHHDISSNEVLFFVGKQVNETVCPS